MSCSMPTGTSKSRYIYCTPQSRSIAHQKTTVSNAKRSVQNASELFYQCFYLQYRTLSAFALRSLPPYYSVLRRSNPRRHKSNLHPLQKENSCFSIPMRLAFLFLHISRIIHRNERSLRKRKNPKNGTVSIVCQDYMRGCENYANDGGGREGDSSGSESKLSEMCTDYLSKKSILARAM